MEKKRCPWVDLTKPDYIDYHDKEWGVLVTDDQTLFEFLVLESAQAGLSWYTVLKKRDHYRKAFDQFNAKTIANYNEEKIEELMANPGIIRNRLKIKATISNAQQFLQIQKEFGSFKDYMWSFAKEIPVTNEIKTLDDYPVTTEVSDAISKDMKKRGFKFFGSTICYAHMQATGMVNDHSVDCFRRQEIIESR